MKGLFWNYISVGIDAKAAYNFHSLREARPWAASGRLVNQAWYAYFSLRTGWFCAAPPIARKLKLKARSRAAGIRGLEALQLVLCARGRTCYMG